jgi:DNA-directed RNA polymerase sigma subunit (sigma70/sigma32)
MEDYQIEELENRLDSEGFKKTVDDLLDQMPKKKGLKPAEVLRLRFGLDDDGNKKTQKEISSLLDITLSRVRASES